MKSEKLTQIYSFIDLQAITFQMLNSMHAIHDIW